MKIVTRFAPSPTGYLHIGSLRTVLYNYIYAKQNGGKFMLRVEDTDRTRLVEGSDEHMIKMLIIMGLVPDEGPNNPGDFGPYHQSERLDIYAKYIKELLDKDKAYYCFCSSERLDKLREEQSSLGLPTKYDKHCRYLSKEEVEKNLKEGMPYTIRLKVPENEEIVFDDIVKGKVKVNSKEVDEQILIKTDGFPTYHFAVVVDDHLMEVTHVIRGDEWTPSTPKHVLLYKAFGWESPTFVHLPNLLGNDRKKLSKRTGDVSVESYLEKGYLVEAIINYISLLGWNPKTTQEFFTMGELIEKFDINAVHKAGAVFDIERLNFFNANYVKNMDLEILYDKLITYLETYDKEFFDLISTFPKQYNLSILSELKTRIRFFSEFKSLTTFFYTNSNLPSIEMLLNEKMKITDLDTVKVALNIALDILDNQNNDLSSIENIKKIFVELINETGYKNGQVLWPVRCALSGEMFSPGALELIYILGREKSIERIQKTLQIL